MDLIPNRYPICYIDAVDEMEPGKSIVCTKNVTINESFFRGHFPGNPVMPGDVLKLHIDMEKVRSRMGIVKAVATVDDRRVCSAELTFIVAEREEKL